MNNDDRLSYRLLLAVDLSGYSGRDAREQLRVQNELHQVLGLAAEGTGLDRGLWYKQVSGDGELAVLPEMVDVSHVVGDFPHQLEAIVRDLNGDRGTRDVLRVRLAIHYGTLIPGPFGPAGSAPVVVSRLLDCRPLRRRLAENRDRPVALAVSGSLYEDVIRTGFCALDAARFRAVRVFAKGTPYRGYVYHPEMVEAGVAA